MFGLEYQHAIPVAVESIALLDRFFICTQNPITPATGLTPGLGECADHHDQGGFWNVKVREQSVHDFETVRGIDEQ